MIFPLTLVIGAGLLGLLGLLLCLLRRWSFGGGLLVALLLVLTGASFYGYQHCPPDHLAVSNAGAAYPPGHYVAVLEDFAVLRSSGSVSLNVGALKLQFEFVVVEADREVFAAQRGFIREAGGTERFIIQRLVPTLIGFDNRDGFQEWLDSFVERFRKAYGITLRPGGIQLPSAPKPQH